MADDDANLPADYDLVPVDHTPQFSDAPVPKAGQTVQQPNVMGDISSMPGKVASAVGDVTGVSDAYKAATGQMTPEEAQMFALGALPMLAGGPEAKVAGELAPGAVKTAKGIVQDIATYAGEHGAPDMESGSPLHNVTLNGTYPADFYSGKGLQYYAPGHDTPGVDAGVYHKIVATKDQPDEMVNAYRAIPWEGKRPQFTLNSGGPSGAVINPGDWVTLSRQYAKDHGESALNGQYAIVSKKVPARELFTNGDSYHEWGWDPRASQPQEAAPPQPQGIRAYHGSPYDFNAFDLSKIGTGEGAQAYGHGLYFAENPAVAAEYKRELAGKEWTVNGDVVGRYGYVGQDPVGNAAARIHQAMGDEDGVVTPEIVQTAKNRMYEVATHNPGMYSSKNLADIRTAMDNLIGQQVGAKFGGHQYEVNINADPEHFLDWDKPLSEQHPVVQDALNKIGGPAATMLPDAVTQGRNGKWYTMRGDQVVGRYDGWPDADTANEAMRVMKQNAVPNYTFGEWQKKMNVPFPEEKLAQLGIPGIKYLDQGSRGQTTWTAIHPQGGINDFPNEQQARAFVAKNPEYSLEAPKQTSNYVVFNDKLIDIVKKYGLAGLVAGGASHFSTVPVDHQPDFPDQNGMADGGMVDDATDAPTDPNNSIAPLATALNQAVPNFDPEAAGFRPSTNIEDVRNKPLWRKAIETITRKPLPGDLTNYAKGGSVKATKTQANYRGGTAKKRCGICSMFQPPRGCSAVRGVISPQALCDFYERAKDLKTLYVMRPLLNAGDVIAWAKSQGFKKTVTAGDMHVTIAFSRDEVDHHALKPDRGPLVASGGKRTVKPLGEEGAVVLAFESSQLAARWKEFRDIGASWDWDSYQPHVTITYDGEGMDLKGIKPYTGPLRFGPEKFSELDEDAKEKITERASGGRVDGVKIDATHDGPWMSCMSIDGSTMYRNKNIPATANIKGKTVDVDDMLLHHEVPERDDLEKLIAEFKVRFKREPNKNERKAIYLKAHNRSGTPNERAHAKKIGVDWKAWSAWCRGEESKIEKMKFTNQPKDADVKPIPHSHEELEAMDHASAA